MVIVPVQVLREVVTNHRVDSMSTLMNATTDTFVVLADINPVLLLHQAVIKLIPGITYILVNMVVNMNARIVDILRRLQLQVPVINHLLVTIGMNN